METYVQPLNLLPLLQTITPLLLYIYFSYYFYCMQKHYTTIGYVLLSITLIVPGIHKLNGAIPPDWFLGKFENSVIGMIPFGVSLSYLIIMFIELFGGLLLLASGIKTILNKPTNRFDNLGVFSAHLLFLMLTFGNFLVQDYDGAFQDFAYFVGVVIIDRLLLTPSLAEKS